MEKQINKPNMEDLKELRAKFSQNVRPFSEAKAKGAIFSLMKYKQVFARADELMSRLLIYDPALSIYSPYLSECDQSDDWFSLCY